MKSGHRKILQSSLTVSFFTLLMGIFNYLTLIILASRFGTRVEMDAFFAATTVPQLVLAILYATLSNVLIPVFIESRSREESKAWRMASLCTNLVFIFLCIFVIVGSRWSENVIALINPGFPEGTSALSASLFQLFLMSLVFSGTSVVLSSLHYAQQKYFLPSLAQGLNSLITFLFVLSFRSSLGIKSIALGTILGSLIQFFILLPLLLKKQRYRFTLDFRTGEMGKLSLLMLPLLAGSIIYKANTLVERFIASNLGEGAISYLGYANRIISALLVMITQGLSTVLFPRMSEYSARKDFQGLSEILSKGLRVLVIVTFPVAFLLILARYELVRLVFERGGFTPLDTQAVGKALVAYLGFFVAASLGLPIVNALYSLQETFRVGIFGVFGFIIYVFLAFTLSHHFSYTGIAMAASIQSGLNIFIFYSIIQRKLGRQPNLLLIRSLFKSITASGFMTCALLGSQRFIKGLVAYPFDLIILGVFSIFIYALVLVILKTEEIGFVIPLPFFRKGRI